MAEPQRPGNAGPTEAVADRIAELVTTTLETGASVTRSLAALTTTRELPPRGDAPLEDIIKFAAAAAGNLVHRAVDAVQTAERMATKVTPAPGGSGVPRVGRGSVLRVPLLVENTGPTPTTELGFRATEVVRTAGGDGDDIPVDRITFTPPTLTIAQRDFEKLTVRVHTDESTAPGTYRATIIGGEGWFTTTIEFEVVDRTVGRQP